MRPKNDKKEIESVLNAASELHRRGVKLNEAFKRAVKEIAFSLYKLFILV